MKKTYMEPTLEVVKIETTQMLAASVEGFNSVLNETGGSGEDALAPGLELPGLNLPGMNLPQ